MELGGWVEWVPVHVRDAFCACACAFSCVWWVLVREMALLAEVAVVMGVVQGVLVLVLVAILQELGQVALGLVTGILVVAKQAVAAGVAKQQVAEAMLVVVQE